MSHTDKEILYTDIFPPGCTTRGLFIGHPGLVILQRSGLSLAGMDERVSGSHWGEGLSPTHLLYFVTTGTVSCQEGTVHASAGDLLILPAGFPKRLSCATGRMEAVYLHLLNRGEWAHLQGNLPRRLDSRHHRPIHCLTEELLHETRQEKPGTAEVLRHLSALLLLYLRRETEDPGSRTTNSRQALLNEIWLEVSTRLDERWSISRLSHRAHLSEGHFHRLVKEQEGVSPMEKLQQMRMEEAMGLLRTTTLSLEAIALRVGYSTAYAFSNAFYSHTGVRPGRFRSEPGPVSPKNG